MVKYIKPEGIPTNMELRMYEYRLYPSKKQIVKLNNIFSHCKFVYNELLGMNKILWTTKKFDFNGLVLDLKICNPEIGEKVHSQVLQNISDRLSKAFDNFFNRIKLRKKGIKIKAGFPRFKSKIGSITFPQSGFKFLSNKKLQISKVGSLPIVLHRIPKGKIKTLTIKCNNANQWFAVFSCEIDTLKVKHTSKNKIGIDVGITKFLTDNKGYDIVNPRFYIQAQKKLKRLQRRQSKKIKGSKNREKARVILARQHLKVFNQRTNFLHKLTSTLTKENKIICGENLNIKNMVKNHNLAKHILDVSWGRFYNMLSYKAVTCGGEIRKNPKTRGSSKRCSNCKTIVEMPLSKRTMNCPHCGLSMCRDRNAAINHLNDTDINDTDGLPGISTPVESLPLPSLLRKASKLIEAGTINNN